MFILDLIKSSFSLDFTNGIVSIMTVAISFAEVIHQNCDGNINKEIKSGGSIHYAWLSTSEL